MRYESCCFRYNFVLLSMLCLFNVDFLYFWCLRYCMFGAWVKLEWIFVPEGRVLVK